MIFNAQVNVVKFTEKTSF